MGKTRKIFFQSVLVSIFLLSVASHAEPPNDVELTAGDPGVNHEFGASVAIDGTTLVVGAPGRVFLTGQGAVYVFDQDQGDPGSWEQTTVLEDSEISNGSALGFPVAIRGDLVAAAARLDDEAGFDAGSVYLWDRHQGGPASWGLVAKLTASDSGPFQRFGSGLGFDGDTLVAGAPGFATDMRGHAYVFSPDANGDWVETVKLTPSDSQGDDQFGVSAAVSGDLMVVGAFADDHSGLVSAGSAYVFVRDGLGQWQEVDKLIAGEPIAFGSFGGAVGITGETIWVGAQGDSTFGFRNGAVYIYEPDSVGSGNWVQVQKLFASDAALGHKFGDTLSVDGDLAIVGAPWNNDPPADLGSVAYLFHRSPQTGLWAEIERLAPLNPPTDEGFLRFSDGLGIDANTNTAVVGMPGRDDASLTDSGTAILYFPLVERVISIPTLDSAGLMLLTLTMAGIGLAGVRRRRLRCELDQVGASPDSSLSE